MALHAFVALTVKSASKPTVYALVVSDCYNGVKLAQSQTKRFVPGCGCFMLFQGSRQQSTLVLCALVVWNFFGSSCMVQHLQGIGSLRNQLDCWHSKGMGLLQ
jgi:hypothetical protein